MPVQINETIQYGKSFSKTNIPLYSPHEIQSFGPLFEKPLKPNFQSS